MPLETCFAVLQDANALSACLDAMTYSYGLLGLFVASILANATLFVVVPIDLVVFAIGASTKNLFDVLVTGIVSGTGATIGEMTAYIVGLFGNSIYSKVKKEDATKIHEIAEHLNEKGVIVIFFGAATPFPFDLIGIAAGLVQYDWKKFFLAALAGKLVRYVALAVIGFYGVSSLSWLFGL